ncbi:hypothetical protein SDC9_109061 [bioreactor metagenome]|uniref:Uncharacterized protein n=1 Tax=bioreactor metagenome TaxID=1076179 RepID=A0A645B9U0_9ZZZZ
MPHVYIILCFVLLRNGHYVSGLRLILLIFNFVFLFGVCVVSLKIDLLTVALSFGFRLALWDKGKT